MGGFAALTPGGRVAVSAEAKAALVEEPSAQKVEGTCAAFATCKTAPGEGLQC